MRKESPERYRNAEMVITGGNPRERAHITASGAPMTEAVPLMHHAQGMNEAFFVSPRYRMADGKGNPIAKPRGKIMTAERMYFIASGREMREARIQEIPIRYSKMTRERITSDSVRVFFGWFRTPLSDVRLPSPALIRMAVITALTDMTGWPRKRMKRLMRPISRNMKARPKARKG